MNKIILNLGLTHCPAISWIMEWIPWRQSSVDFLPGPTKTIDDTTKEWKVPLRARTIVISHLISPTEDVMNRPRTRRRSLHSVVVRLEGSIVQRCVEMWNLGQKLFQCPGRYMGVSHGIDLIKHITLFILLVLASSRFLGRFACKKGPSKKSRSRKDTHGHTQWKGFKNPSHE